MELSGFARSLTAEAAFTVLAVAKRLQSEGKDVVELEIGDSPFATTSAAAEAGREAIAAGQTRYCASLGLPELRDAAARYMRDQFGVPASRDKRRRRHRHQSVRAVLLRGPSWIRGTESWSSARTFRPTCRTSSGAAAARSSTPLRQEDAFRPSLAAVERFLAEDPRPRAIFLNSPHNPTGGVATEEDFRGIADLVRGTRVAVFSDEPYCHMVWKGRHVSPPGAAGDDGALGGRLHLQQVVQHGGLEAGVRGRGARDRRGDRQDDQHQRLNAPRPSFSSPGWPRSSGTAANATRPCAGSAARWSCSRAGSTGSRGSRPLDPHATFYVFPKVVPVCNRLGITSHGLAMYLLEGADDDFGVACLGGECFGDAGAGFLRFSCRRLRRAPAGGAGLHFRGRDPGGPGGRLPRRAARVPARFAVSGRGGGGRQARAGGGGGLAARQEWRGGAT